MSQTAKSRIDELGSETATQPANARKADMKLEVVVVPVSDVDRAKKFYGGLGWRLDGDFVVGEEFRGVQFTPPGSPSSIHFGKGITSASARFGNRNLISSCRISRRRALSSLGRGVEVSEVFHRCRSWKAASRAVGYPERRSYSSFATFKDPDGNEWLLQEITSRFPGRVETERRPRFTSSTGACERAPARVGRPWRAREAERRPAR